MEVPSWSIPTCAPGTPRPTARQPETSKTTTHEWPGASAQDLERAYHRRQVDLEHPGLMRQVRQFELRPHSHAVDAGIEGALCPAADDGGIDRGHRRCRSVARVGLGGQRLMHQRREQGGGRSLAVLSVTVIVRTTPLSRQRAGAAHGKWSMSRGVRAPGRQMGARFIVEYLMRIVRYATIFGPPSPDRCHHRRALRGAGGGPAGSQAGRQDDAGRAGGVGAELDLLLLRRGRRWGFEFKCTDAPRTTKSMHVVVDDLGLEHLWVVYPGDREYPLADAITALPLKMIRACVLDPEKVG